MSKHCIHAIHQEHCRQQHQMYPEIHVHTPIIEEPALVTPMPIIRDPPTFGGAWMPTDNTPSNRERELQEKGRRQKEMINNLEQTCEKYTSAYRVARVAKSRLKMKLKKTDLEKRKACKEVERLSIINRNLKTQCDRERKKYDRIIEELAVRLKQSEDFGAIERSKIIADAERSKSVFEDRILSNRKNRAQIVSTNLLNIKARRVDGGSGDDIGCRQYENMKAGLSTMPCFEEGFEMSAEKILIDELILMEEEIIRIRMRHEDEINHFRNQNQNITRDYGELDTKYSQAVKNHNRANAAIQAENVSLREERDRLRLRLEDERSSNQKKLDGVINEKNKALSAMEKEMQAKLHRIKCIAFQNKQNEILMLEKDKSSVILESQQRLEEREEYYREKLSAMSTEIGSMKTRIGELEQEKLFLINDLNQAEKKNNAANESHVSKQVEILQKQVTIEHNLNKAIKSENERLQKELGLAQASLAAAGPQNALEIKKAHERVKIAELKSNKLKSELAASQSELKEMVERWNKADARVLELESHVRALEVQLNDIKLQYNERIEGLKQARHRLSQSLAEAKSKLDKNENMAAKNDRKLAEEYRKSLMMPDYPESSLSSQTDGLYCRRRVDTAKYSGKIKDTGKK